MSDEERKDQPPINRGTAPAAEVEQPAPKSPQPKRGLLPLPGLAAIALYLVLLAFVIVFGVLTGHYRSFFLIFPVFLIAASGGLVMRFRWAWAMALAAAVLLSGYNLWLFASLHMVPGIIQGMLNLLIFLYLVRTEVREKLR
ncbi:MAG TPA: hypothetical protein VGF82_22640 [Terracidiphilus sp.]|jgi:hypothetical protein